MGKMVLSFIFAFLWLFSGYWDYCAFFVLCRSYFILCEFPANFFTCLFCYVFVAFSNALSIELKLLSPTEELHLFLPVLGYSHLKSALFLGDLPCSVAGMWGVLVVTHSQGRVFPLLQQVRLAFLLFPFMLGFIFWEVHHWFVVEGLWAVFIDLFWPPHLVDHRLYGQCLEPHAATRPEALDCRVQNDGQSSLKSPLPSPESNF